MLVDDLQVRAIISDFAVMIAIVLMVLGLNLMGDGLRDMLDPRLRRVRQ